MRTPRHRRVPGVAVVAVAVATCLAVSPATAGAQDADPGGSDVDRTLVGIEIPDPPPGVRAALEDLEQRLDDALPGDPVDLIDVPGETSAIGLDTHVVPAPIQAVAPLVVDPPLLAALEASEAPGDTVDPSITRDLVDSRIAQTDEELASLRELAEQKPASEIEDRIDDRYADLLSLVTKDAEKKSSALDAARASVEPQNDRDKINHDRLTKEVTEQAKGNPYQDAASIIRAAGGVLGAGAVIAGGVVATPITGGASITGVVAGVGNVLGNLAKLGLTINRVARR